jgi:hypothetical protein
MTTRTRKAIAGAVIVIAAAAVAIGAAAFVGDGDTPVSNEDDTAASQGQLQGLRGTITGPNGRRIAGALVTPQSVDVPAKAVPELAVLSDDDGRYEWTLDPGKYEITVSADGYQTQTKNVTVEPGDAAPLDFVLQPS